MKSQKTNDNRERKKLPRKQKEERKEERKKEMEKERKHKQNPLPIRTDLFSAGTFLPRLARLPVSPP